MKTTTVYFLAIAIVFAGCKDFKKSINDTLTHTDSISSLKADSDSGRNYGSDLHSQKNEDEKSRLIPLASQQEKLENAEKTLRQLPQFQGKPIFIYKLIHFYSDGRIITNLQNPENPTYVDEYRYEDGQWLSPKPVVLFKHDDVERDIVNIDRLAFKNANNVYKAIEEKRMEIGSKDSDYTIYATIRDNKIHWHPGSLGNERSVYSIEYHENGTLRSSEQQ